MADGASLASSRDDPSDASNGDLNENDVASEIIAAPPPPTTAEDDTVGELPGANRHYLAPSRTGTFESLKNRRDRRRLRAYPRWEKDPDARRPYHEYVHQLVEGGWDMMTDLDQYLNTDIEDAQLTISILDIAADGSKCTRWPELYDESDLADFMAKNGQRPPGSVRLYLTEQKGGLAAGVIEALGAGLDLDPRFFQWSLVGHKHVLSPSHRHHAPYVSIGFAVPKPETRNRTDVERFNVTVYVKKDDVGSGWTGVLLFSSHTKVKVSPYNLHAPPAFSAPRPPPVEPAERSFRELFLAVYPSLDLPAAVASPFYAVHLLLRLNYVTWSDVIASIRSEDRRIHGISDTSVGHAEEIAKALALVQRGGSLDWAGRDEFMATEVRTALEEDFRHLVQETEALWQERGKTAAVRQRRSEHRWNLLANTFTFIFAPVSIMSGIYGMNVYEIIGSGPDIWQFFVAVIALNFLILLGLVISNWVHIFRTHYRKATFKEAIGLALGRWIPLRH